MPLNNSTLNTEPEMPQKWYREFWAWFILSPLIVVVIVSSFTVTVAVKGADDRVIENYYKEGRMINASFAEDTRAADLGVRLNIEFDPQLQEVIIDVNESSGLLPERLVLEMLHPSEFDFDRKYTLTAIAANRYQGELQAEPLLNKRYLRVSAEFDDAKVQSWRVRGEVNFAKLDALTTVTLKPEQ